MITSLSCGSSCPWSLAQLRLGWCSWCPWWPSPSSAAGRTPGPAPACCPQTQEGWLMDPPQSCGLNRTWPFRDTPSGSPVITPSLSMGSLELSRLFIFSVLGIHPLEGLGKALSIHPPTSFLPTHLTSPAHNGLLGVTVNKISFDPLKHPALCLNPSSGYRAGAWPQGTGGQQEAKEGKRSSARAGPTGRWVWKFLWIFNAAAAAALGG